VELLSSKEEHALACLGGFDAEEDRRMGFSDGGGTHEQDILGGFQKVE
jgi:hypothetical protein